MAAGDELLVWRDRVQLHDTSELLLDLDLEL